MLQSLLLWTVLTPALSQIEDTTARRVYVLHSGVHIILAHPRKNFAAEYLSEELRFRGVSSRDIVVLDCPFPQASRDNMFPREGLTMFLDLMMPTSRAAHDAYRRLHDSLRKHDVKPGDRLIWIGYSAGGQVGMTMARLAADLPRYPDLAGNVPRYTFDTVVTLGTPVGGPGAPANVRRRHYYSAEDKVVRLLCGSSNWLLFLGYNMTVRPVPKHLEGDALVRIYEGVTHPEWIFEDRILDRVLDDCRGPALPLWREPMPLASASANLGQLMGRLLESECRMCVEEVAK